MYRLNGIPLDNYGIQPGRAPLSNVALSGFMDMPKRLGKTFHDWLDDEGLEPYVEADELFFGGRTLTYYGLLKGSSKQDAVLKLRELYEDFGRLTDLITLSTPWGDFQVYLKDQIRVGYVADGWAQIEMRFQQPVVPLPVAALPLERTIQQYHIDYIPFSAFGAFVADTDGQYDRPALKEAAFTSYNQEGYQLTKISQSEIDLVLWFSASDMATLQSRIGQLHSLLAAPGTRTVNIDDTEREGFAVDGFQVTHVRNLADQCIAQVRVSLLLAFAGIPVVQDYLLDNKLEGIQDDQGRFILIDQKQYLDLLDDRGYNILDNKLQPIKIG